MLKPIPQRNTAIRPKISAFLLTLVDGEEALVVGMVNDDPFMIRDLVS